MDHHHDSSSTRDETLSCQRPSPLPRRRYVTSMRGVDVKKSRSHHISIAVLHRHQWRVTGHALMSPEFKIHRRKPKP
ncbi:hypothetical protein F2Q69_00027084 [Brassica cretica]|uniref:Uncharacterized protein n=1 Tax=Brassica cretica TaxID=69181 RepID=A0A8S9S3Q4_BRACR|nr:hypothetical protein F2Q69_00027084 [Brassica cretica]